MLTDKVKMRSMHKQGGALIIEFALIFIIFFTLLLGIMEFGRWLYALNAAGEATRWGARLAVVCDMNDDVIKKKMKNILQSLTDDEIAINYSPSACDSPDCFVTVSLINAKHTLFIIKPKAVNPLTEIDTTLFRTVINLPAFPTTLPRESLDSAESAPGNNEICNE